MDTVEDCREPPVTVRGIFCNDIRLEDNWHERDQEKGYIEECSGDILAGAFSSVEVS